MTLALPLILNFASALSWIMLVHYIDRIVEKTVDPSRQRRKKLIYRISSATFVTVVNHFVYLLATSTLNRSIGLGVFYGISFHTFVNVVKVIVVNTILFSGNWMCHFS